MKTLKVIVIDDEGRTQQLIAKMIRSFNLNLEVIVEGDDVKSGVKAIQTHKPDIVFLDIQMPNGTGFDILDALPVKNFEVVFVTAYEEFAIKAIKFSALDYIVKPIDPEELRTATENAIAELKNKRDPNRFETLQHNIVEHKQRRLVLKTMESVHIVTLSEIIRCESDRNYTLFHLTNDRKILVSKTLKEFEFLLKDYNFLRVQQSHLINLDFIDRYDKTEGGTIIMKDGANVPLSVAKRDLFFETISKL